MSERNEKESWWWEWTERRFWIMREVYLCSRSKVYCWCGPKGTYVDDACKPGHWSKATPPPEPTMQSTEPLSRSRLRREAVQRGEEMPTFDSTDLTPRD